MWMTSNWLERKQNIDPMWKVLNEEVDLGEPTSFFDRVSWDAFKDNAKKKQRYCGQLQSHV